MTTHTSFRTATAAGLLGLLLAAGAQAQPGRTGIDASGDPRTERVACEAGLTAQDKATCLRETAAAAAERRHGTLDNGHDRFTANALKRCDVLQGADKIACASRVIGYGEAEGSVAGGGVLKTTETVVVPAGEPAVTVDAQTAGPLLVITAPN